MIKPADNGNNGDGNQKPEPALNPEEKAISSYVFPLKETTEKINKIAVIKDWEDENRREELFETTWKAYQHLLEMMDDGAQLYIGRYSVDSKNKKVVLMPLFTHSCTAKIATAALEQTIVLPTKETTRQFLAHYVQHIADVSPLAGLLFCYRSKSGDVITEMATPKDIDADAMETFFTVCDNALEQAKTAAKKAGLYNPSKIIMP